MAHAPLRIAPFQVSLAPATPHIAREIGGRLEALASRHLDGSH
eukprot:CAMPEP_0179494982 /NCGR_PEP_ID=MMETSP0799-20121207/68490_1 /TAXON_ID=46947 /ORGANISM="Geminigera cryophila, Strain CCMP2564" /LENGTH=42 /DNA_ID= /DNA_START= /DNA_END= /DNA_ORIENTATION=